MFKVFDYPVDEEDECEATFELISRQDFDELKENDLLSPVPYKPTGRRRSRKQLTRFLSKRSSDHWKSEYNVQTKNTSILTSKFVIGFIVLM